MLDRPVTGSLLGVEVPRSTKLAEKASFFFFSFAMGHIFALLATKG